MSWAFARRVCLATGATLLMLLAVEGLLVLAGLPDQGLYVGDRVTDWRLRGHLEERVVHEATGESFSLSTSSRGFRDEEWGSEGPGIVALGCSTTFGWGVEASEAWPSHLERLLGRPVLNAAIPGQSTHQGMKVALELLEEKPDGLVLGWIVRDAQRAARADKEAKAPSGLRNTRLFRLVRGKLSNSSIPVLETSPHRVDPEDYSQNLRVILDKAKANEVPVILLAFPSQDPSPGHLSVLRELGAFLVEPRLPVSAFFPEDPVHLNSTGHQQLADIVFSSVQAEWFADPVSEEDGSTRPE